MRNARDLYKSPPHRGIRDLASVTDEQLAAIREGSAATEAENHATWVALKAEHVAILKTAEKLWGKTSNEYRYLARTSVPTCPFGSLGSFLADVEYARTAAAKERAAATQVADRAALTERAVAWLLARGKTIGTDFTLADAVHTANDLAFNDECERRTAELKASGEHVPFNGQNCDHYEDRGCLGWDGESNRCSCGNRRVSWSTGWGHSFESPDVNAEAH